jgi:hypothetical protein
MNKNNESYFKQYCNSKHITLASLAGYTIVGACSMVIAGPIIAGIALTSVMIGDKIMYDFTNKNNNININNAAIDNKYEIIHNENDYDNDNDYEYDYDDTTHFYLETTHQ